VEGQKVGGATILEPKFAARIQAFLDNRTPGWDLGVAFGCGHNPIQHKGFQCFRNDVLRAMDPDWVVNLGDAHEATYASRWPTDQTFDARQEFAVLADDFDQVNQAASRAKKVWLWGNHDDNAQQPGRIPEKLVGAIMEYREHILAPVLKGWKQVPYAHDEWYRIGQIVFQHGCQTNVYAERDQAMAYGVPYGLHVSAHTHRPVQPTPVEISRIPIFGMHYTNVGTGADWSQMNYIKRSKHMTWGRGVLIFETNAKQRRSAFASKQWACDLLIHSMANERAMR
jgi:hypothetical protein